MASSTPVLSRQKILHVVRTYVEHDHRLEMARRSADFRWLYQPNVSDLDLLAAEMTHADANDCFNKTVPVYIFSAKRSFYTSLLLKVLHDFLYAKWYRPYRNQVEYGRFLAKTFLAQLLPGDLQPGALADFAIPVNDVICTRAQAAQDAIRRLDPDRVEYNREELQDPNLPPEWWGAEGLRLPKIFFHDQRKFILQPLFQAIIISVRLETFNKDTELSQLPVLFILTGTEAGLSAPISFDPIAHKISSLVHSPGGKTAAQMTLETAAEFVMRLESREVAAFGYQPSPAVSSQELDDTCLWGVDIMGEARRFGWGDEPLVGPSSQWVAEPQEAISWETDWNWVDSHFFFSTSYMLEEAVRLENSRPGGRPRGLPWRGGKLL